MSTDTKTNWQQRYAEAVGQFVEAVDLAEDRTRRSERLEELLDDAILAIHEAKVVHTVLAAGFHPFHSPGADLVDALRSDLADGTLDPDDITRELVWQIASIRELETDLTPIL